MNKKVYKYDELNEYVQDQLIEDFINKLNNKDIIDLAEETLKTEMFNKDGIIVQPL